MERNEQKSNVSAPIGSGGAGAASLTSTECDSGGATSLYNLLSSFTTSMNVDVAWALCYQCAKCFNSALVKNREKCYVVSDLKDVLIQADGNIHPDTIYRQTIDDRTRTPLKSEQELVCGLGLIIFSALDFHNESSAELELSVAMEELINYMTSSEDDDDSELERLDGNDDEGIERDSGEYDGENAGPSSLISAQNQKHKSLAKVKQLCVDRIGPDAEKHYKNVCRAFYAEATELATFLETIQTKQTNASSCSDLDKLQTMDWSRFWVQVIGELRMGVKLKKVDFSRTPIEYELTPYEILMDDIRSRRYKLRKIMVDGDIPPRVKKDAHAVILEFIRARPPLRRASDRKLPPLIRSLTPREQLLMSIQRGRQLKPTSRLKPQNLLKVLNDTPPENTSLKSETDSGQPKRRLLKADFSALELGNDDDDDLDSPTTETDHGFLDSKIVYGKTQNNGTFNTTKPTILQQQQSVGNTNPWKRTAYDLATQCPSRRASMRRHTVVACVPELPAPQCHSTPHSQPTSRPDSRLSHGSTDTADSQMGTTIPEMSWSRSSLQDELLQSKQWQEAMSLDDRLSLTLEEIVHIRSVLTKAELEGLPVEGHVKEDVEKRKVCFLCLKTRFGIFGPWGQRCRLCKRTVCTKCYSKMRIPTEHFLNVPVVLLSPTLMSSPDDDSKDSFPKSLMARLMVPEQQNTVLTNTVGSAPSSPNFQRNNTVNTTADVSISSSAPGSRVESRMANSMEGLPAESPASTISERRARNIRSRTLGRPDKTADKLKGIQMIVCHDCKTMVIQIIKSSRLNRTATRNNTIRNLTLNLAPVY